MNSIHITGNSIPENYQVVEVQLQDLSKLFDTMDPSPLCKKALHPSVVEHIVDSVREYSRRASLALVLHVNHAVPGMQNDAVICDAVRAYFTDLSVQERRKLRLHLRRGVISLFIGLAVLAAALVGSRFLGESTIASTVRESLDIGGWVALWRPMEMFLYDWWPLLGNRLLYRRLGHMPVQIRYLT